MTFKQLAEIKKIVTEVINDLSMVYPLQETSIAISKLNILNGVNEVDQEFGKILNICDNILKEHQSIVQILEKLVDTVDKEMENTGLELSQNSEYTSLFSEASLYSNYTNLRSDRVENVVRSRINLYSNWRFPALLLYYRLGNKINRIDYMVSSDPLYIAYPNTIVHHDEVIAHTVVYTSQYRNRLRFYPIDKQDYSILPKNQFNLIVLWDYFNIVSIDQIELYLTKLLDLLRPGGVIIFSFNDAEIVSSAELVDLRCCSWATKSYMSTLLIRLGFTDVISLEIETETVGHYVSWVEAKKPGELKTVKEHQVLGTIHQK